MSIGSRIFGAIGFRPAEKRDVQFSPALSVLLASLSRGNIALSGINVNQDTALKHMAVWGCVKVISEDIASLPLNLYRKASSGREEAISNPLHDLLKYEPNPDMDSGTFRQTLTAHALTFGNAYANAVYRNGRPAELWPIHPSQVQVRRLSNGQLEYTVTPTGGLAQNIPLNRIFHLRGPSIDGIMGLNPIAYARETVGLGLASEQFAAGFFAHGAKPSMVFETPQELSDEAHARLRSDLEATLTGLGNAQRTAILEGGMTAKTLFVPPEDAQFIEQRAFGILEICRLFRVQPHKLAVTDSTMSYNSVEQANISHVVDTIRPWAVRWEQAIRKYLIAPEERSTIYAEHELQALLRGDAASRSEFYRTLWNLGALTANEIRAFEGLNDIDGGDETFVPVNMQTTTKAAMEPMMQEMPQNVTPMQNPAAASQ